MADFDKIIKNYVDTLIENHSLRSSIKLLHAKYYRKIAENPAYSIMADDIVEYFPNVFDIDNEDK